MAYSKNSHIRKQNVEREKKSWKVSDRWGIDEAWSGTAVIYSAVGLESWALTGDYDVTYCDESNPEELRAYREVQRRRGKSVKKLGKNKVRDHLVVIFGAEMSARTAVTTLSALIDRITTEGLNTGRYKLGNFVQESAKRVPRPVKKAS
jgi:hypothetical protein